MLPDYAAGAPGPTCRQVTPFQQNDLVTALRQLVRRARACNSPANDDDICC
jgi:hypothetical protein